MINQEMVEITIHDVPEDLSRKIEDYARIHYMSNEEVISQAIAQYIKDTKKSANDVPKYQVIDFDGEVPWGRLPNNTYIVDPQYLDTFKRIILMESDETNR